MSSREPIDPDLVRSVKRALRRFEQRSEAEREILLQQAIDQALSEELAEDREESQRAAELLREELTRDTRAEEAAHARRVAPTKILQLLLILLFLILFAVAIGRADIISFPRTRAAPVSLNARITSADHLTSQAPGQAVSQEICNYSVPSSGTALSSFYEVDQTFYEFYQRRGGEPVFGRAISPAMMNNGRMMQWFERARLEAWPESPDPGYKIQSGRVGVEFTSGVSFPSQIYFGSRSGTDSQSAMRYFAETNHGVRDPFLSFWANNGGLDIFGFPISEEVRERLPDGQEHTVQYFERARLELHGSEVKIGLLGTALYLCNNRPNIVQAPQPTPGPLPPVSGQP